jgi:hypothetical protein
MDKAGEKCHKRKPVAQSSYEGLGIRRNAILLRLLYLIEEWTHDVGNKTNSVAFSPQANYTD